jgi:hypothetical protein
VTVDELPARKLGGTVVFLNMIGTTPTATVVVRVRLVEVVVVVTLAAAVVAGFFVVVIVGFDVVVVFTVVGLLVETRELLVVLTKRVETPVDLTVAVFLLVVVDVAIEDSESIDTYPCIHTARNGRQQACFTWSHESFKSMCKQQIMMLPMHASITIKSIRFQGHI